MIEILYEDEFYVFVNKPNNLLVHHSHYARNIEENSLMELLPSQGIEAYPIHRLDRKTSGVLALAKKKEFVAPFQLAMEQNRVEKTYHALVRGHITASGTVDSPVKNDRGNYKDALTHFRCIKQFELEIPVTPYPTARYSLVEFKPKTGRMHQLRIHANKISHPIIGDPKYGNRHHNHMFIEKWGIDFLFLHAQTLDFEHPFTTTHHAIEAKKAAFWDMWLH
jgi:tRNA pseudouridine65 synthase